MAQSVTDNNPIMSTSHTLVSHILKDLDSLLLTHYLYYGDAHDTVSHTIKYFRGYKPYVYELVDMLEPYENHVYIDATTLEELLHKVPVCISLFVLMERVDTIETSYVSSSSIKGETVSCQ